MKKAICSKLWKCTSDSEAGNFHFASKCQKYFIKGSASKTSLQEESKQIKETDIQKTNSSKLIPAHGIEDIWDIFAFFYNGFFKNISRISEVLTKSDIKKPVKNHFIFIVKIFTWLCQIEKFYELLSGSAEIFMEKIEKNFSSKSNINQRKNQTKKIFISIFQLLWEKCD